MDSLNIIVVNENFEDNKSCVAAFFEPMAPGEKIEFVNEVPDLFDLLVKLGLFPSKGQARKNWKRGPLLPGFNYWRRLGRFNKEIAVWIPVEFKE